MSIKMENLIDKLNYATKEYDKGTPIMSDKEWDNLYFQLVELEENEGIKFSNSPTQKINYEVKTELKKVTHNHPMLSLDKTKDWNEFKEYFHNINSCETILTMLKLDGLTCSIRYENGKLISAETRGNGEIGEDILHNALVIKSIPKAISYKEELILDGEVICTEEDFKPFADKYKNPRNFAAGSLRLLDSKECEARNLTFVVWNVVKGFEETNSLMSKFDKLKKYDFTVTPYIDNLDSDSKEFLLQKSKELGYPIDGLVGRFDDISLGKSLGETDHHIRAAYAFKFYDEEYETELLNIEWTMGRTGVLSPVAIFKPIDIDGSTVSRASLHNISIMNELSKGTERIGDKLTIFKANQIIPQIRTWSHMEDYSKETCLDIPKVCPICGEPTEIKNNDGVKTLWCGNPNCSGKLINILDHFCGKKGLDIKGLSKATIEKLINWGWLNSKKDLFNLSQYREEWINKDGFGTKSVAKILDAIEASKECELSSFISSIGIPLIGARVSKEICKYYTTWEEFKEAVGGRWSDFEGFGPEMEKAINIFDYTEADEIAEMLVFKQPETSVKDSEATSAEGLTFCITGKVHIWKNRDSLKSYIESIGGKVVGSMSGKVNYLINNDNTSTTAKNNKAKELNIPIITEEEFVASFGQNC